MKANTPVSRRAALRLFALGVVGTVALNNNNGGVKAAPTTEDDFDLSELKKDAESLKYEDEVLSVGPDDREKNPTRVKKPVKEPEYRAEEKELVEKEEQGYDAMVAKEKSDYDRIRAKFSKSK